MLVDTRTSLGIEHPNQDEGGQKYYEVPRTMLRHGSPIAYHNSLLEFCILYSCDLSHHFGEKPEMWVKQTIVYLCLCVLGGSRHRASTASNLMLGLHHSIICICIMLLYCTPESLLLSA